jgi:transcriptional regulator with XRE-family HTH domain
MNPLKEWRRSKGLKRAQLAGHLGVAYHTLANMELGYSPTLPQRWRGPLETLGADFTRLNEEYRAWRARMGTHTDHGVA